MQEILSLFYQIFSLPVVRTTPSTPPPMGYTDLFFWDPNRNFPMPPKLRKLFFVHNIQGYRDLACDFLFKATYKFLNLTSVYFNI